MKSLNNLFNIKDKNILITGATRGLGKSIAISLSSFGANIILTGRDINKLNAIRQEINLHGNKCDVFILDLTSNTLSNTFESILSQTNNIDVLINNAGISTKTKKLPHEYEQTEWDDIMQVNLNSAWKLSNIYCKSKINNNTNGNIINISSIAAFRTMKLNSIYNTSKAALISLTKSLALDYAKYNIRVNAICPGLFPTELTEKFILGEKGKEFIESNIPMSRPGKHEELFGLILYLCSDASSYMTGESIHIDGGLIINNLN